ncbi:hypothetical protein CVT25_004856 [Psilocybe cyanescens]|uniref:Transposase domain-containing protein n=1 Tax=Psilocybe cyanescens TaxID=93625 RepID=A0A409VY18_PSICY|nr:hypothetical protein CVT25_004856 [Psilocybe cyanescens]
MPSVICVCTLCREKTININRVLQPGQLILDRTCLRHEKADQIRAAESPDSEPEIDNYRSNHLLQPNSQKKANINLPVALLVKMICLFAVWLHTRACVSCSVANQIFQVMQLFLSMILTLIEVALDSSGIKVSFEKITIPRDVRSAYQKYCIDPELTQTVCCPKCFYLYHSETAIPLRCTCKKSPRSRNACNAALFDTRNTAKGPKSVPQTFYTTQSFQSCLKFFLSREIIETSLEKTLRKNLDHPVPVDGVMCNIQDSPGWRSLYNSFPSPCNLQFGLYVDWFNPFTNKIAGKTSFCDAIVLYCLNLPPELCYRPENTFIIGLTPPPKAPDMITICHLLEPVIASIGELGIFPGIKIPTFCFPFGVLIQVKIAPFVADLEASNKVAGFMSHKATQFCSFCELTVDNLEDLDYNTWTLRNALATKNGVRWTLHNLLYWDPVHHIILGYLHNWLEGILQHQLRNLWGLGRDEKEKLKELGKEEYWTEEDVSDSFDELEELLAEVSIHELHEQNMDQSLLESENDMDVEMDQPGSRNITPTPQNYHPYSFDDDLEDSDDPDYIPIDDSVIFKFTDNQVQSIRDYIHDISLPTWAQRPPTNLGELSHGKLKAHEYLTLFSVVFPIIIPEFWYKINATALEQQHFKCFYDLIAAINIISSFKTSNTAADKFMEHYIQYHTGVQQLFPYRAEKPNHHYAMHYGSLLKTWGPMVLFSEFPGERLNGLLQNIRTNRKRRDMDLTMLRQMCHQSRVTAMLSDELDLYKLAAILEPVDALAINTSTSAPPTLTAHKIAEFFSTTPQIFSDKSSFTKDNYNSLLQYLHSTGRLYRAYNAFPHPLDSMILQPLAKCLLQFHRGDHTFSCQKSHYGNSAILFYNTSTQKKDTGFINAIWQVPLSIEVHTFIAVSPHLSLTTEEEDKASFIHYPGFESRIVDIIPSDELVIIEPAHIISHLTIYKRPIGTYDIEKETLVVCWALNRGRR